MMDLSVVPYESKCDAVGSPGGHYRECMRNHAASIGGQAFDGCGEFMNSSGGDALKCAACGCHRNFHRRDGLAGGLPRLLPPTPGAFSAYFPSPFAQIPPLAAAIERGKLGLETPPRREERGIGVGVGGLRKRVRTKFTAEQKGKMQAFAEKLGWRIQKHDEAALEEFCVEIGVKRHVLKVWMHNNKHHPSPAAAAVNGGGKQEPSPPASAAAISV